AQVDRPANDGLVARKLRGPQVVADQNDARAPFFFLRSEAASEFGLYAKRREKIPGDDLGVDLDRPVEAGQSELVVVVGNQAFEGVILRAPVEEIGIADSAWLRVVAVNRLRLNQSLRLVVRQRPKHDRVDHAEYGRVSANAQGQGQHRDQSKSRILAELPQGVTQVLK